MTAQRTPRQPIALSDHQCPRCTHERNLRLASERERGLYLTDLIRAEDENRALRRRLAGLTTRPTRAAQAEEWAYDALAGVACVLERLDARRRALWRSLTDPAQRLGTTGRLALFTVVCCCAGIIVRFGV